MATGACNILHISDFHFENSNTNQNIVIKAFLDDLKTIISEAKNISLIVFSGDLVNKGDENSFTQAYSKLLKPALEICNLTNDSLIIVPGNHDVSRKKINEFLEAGLNVIDSRDKLNGFIDKNKEEVMYFTRLEQYFTFFNEIKGNNIITNNYLYQTYVFEVNEIKVGVVGLNSSWRSTGSDYGKLMVGERQIDNALEDIQNCDIKIAVLHHSPDWLIEFDKRDTDKRLANEFDLILSGHNHEQKPKFNFDNNGFCVINQAGCLYHNRNYYNGYSLLKINNSNNSIQINFRTYFDTKRKFDSGIDIIDGGLIEFELKKKDNAPIQLRSSYIDQYKVRYLEEANSTLIISNNALSTTNDIRTAFVIPILAKEPETATDYNQNELLNKSKVERIEIQEIIKNKKSYIIAGQNEAGKSTLLKYIGIQALENSGGNIVPVLIDYKKVESKGNNPFYRAILNALAGISKEKEVLELLTTGRILLLIDDFDVTNNTKFLKLKEFITLYSSIRYIFSIDENMYSNLKLENVKIGTVSFEKAYIHSFKVSHIRELANQWISTGSEFKEKIVQKITSSLIEMGLPFTPTIITFFLYILENNTDIYQVNKSTLVQKFIEVLLNKAGERNENLRFFDFRNKEHLLASVASELLKSNSSSITRIDLETQLLEYSNEYGFKFPISKTVDSLIESGLLNASGDDITFKLKAFAEYFAAIYMTDSVKWYNYILSENEYYKYKNVIDYYSGLKRNDSDLVKLLSDRLDILAELSDYNLLELSDIDKFSPSFDFFDSTLKSNIVEESDKYDISPEEEDAFLEVAPIGNPDQSLKKESSSNISYLFSVTLDILSVVIRNSELISNIDLKQKTISQCFYNWSLSNLSVLNYIKENPEDFPLPINKENTLEVIQTELDKDSLQSIKEKDKKLYPLFVLVQSMITGNLISLFSSEKLAQYLEAIILDSDNPILIRFNSTCVYSYYKLPKYRKYVESMMEELNTNLFLQDVFILHLLRVRKESKSPEIRNFLEDITSNTLANRQESLSKRYGTMYKVIKEERIASIKRNLRKTS